MITYVLPPFFMVHSVHSYSITCAIHTPQMTITRSFITRALRQPSQNWHYPGLDPDKN